tara:strand:- start:417 stop:851 length:435 start_codon:yes stop_codon:yes gene_type:complete
MPTRSSGFTLIELLVVVAVIGILSTIGLVQYQGYIAGTKLKSTKNAMQQILLAQTEELSNSGRYYIQADDKDSCTPSDTTSKQIEDALFAGGDIITTDAGFNMCIYSDDDNAYRIVATNGDDKESGDYKEVVLTHNGLYDPEED